MLYNYNHTTYNRKLFLWVNWPINEHAFVDPMKAFTINKLTSHGCDSDAAILYRHTVFLSKNAVYRTCRGCAGKERTCLPGTATIFAYFYNLNNISCTIDNIHTTTQYIQTCIPDSRVRDEQIKYIFKYLHEFKYVVKCLTWRRRKAGHNLLLIIIKNSFFS